MSETTPSNKIAELLAEALSRGRLVVVSTAPPTCADGRAAILMVIAQTFGLSRVESRGVLALLEHDVVSRGALQAAMAPDGNVMPKNETLNVVIHKIRQRLQPFGVEIVTIYGQGYGLRKDARDKIRKILAQSGLASGAVELHAE